MSLDNQQMGSDRICLQGMRFFGYHGVLPEERTQGQYFEVDAELFYCLDKPEWQDDLQETIDYSLVYQEIQELVEHQQFYLIETLAIRIIKQLLEKYPVEGVRIRVRKPEVPLPGALKWAGVEICRWKTQKLSKQTIVYVALGSNLGDREANLWQALGLLAAEPLVKVTRVSSFYETKPVGNLEQDNFINAVVQLDYELSPLELLKTLQVIEMQLGRERLVHWGPRTIDLDLILFGNQVVREPELTVPHPRMEERDFVLVPLAEIAPDLILPNGHSLQEIISGRTNLQTNLLSKRASHATMVAKQL